MTEWQELSIEQSLPDGSVWVRIIAMIRNNISGQIIEHEAIGILDDNEDMPSSYIWEDGNYACDCNRELFFERAKGNELDDTTCGENRYSVRLINPVDGRIFYDEFE